MNRSLNIPITDKQVSGLIMDAVSWYSSKELPKDMINADYFFFDNH